MLSQATLVAILATLAAAVPTPTEQQAASLQARDSHAVVTGSAAVTSVNNQDGVGAGSTKYTYYRGNGTPSAGWPRMADWASFENLFNANKPNMGSSCSYQGNNLANDSGDEIGAIYDAIQAVAKQGNIDHRFVLAVIMQESGGCVRVPTTNNGDSNPGLMQSFQGYFTCNDNTNIEGDNYAVRTPCPKDYITGMIREGAIGTDTGDGLASNINEAENQYHATLGRAHYYAARLYNSGAVCNNDLSDACGATASYASDIANRLTGWTG